MNYLQGNKIDCSRVTHTEFQGPHAHAPPPPPFPHTHTHTHARMHTHTQQALRSCSGAAISQMYTWISAEGTLQRCSYLTNATMAKATLQKEHCSGVAISQMYTWIPAEGTSFLCSTYGFHLLSCKCTYGFQQKEHLIFAASFLLGLVVVAIKSSRQSRKRARTISEVATKSQFRCGH